MTALPSFRRRWPWITADLQTIRNVLPGRLPGIPPDSGRRIEIPLSDGSGDRLVARFHPGREPVPAVVLVPGLTGCEGSRHVLQSAGAWAAGGAPVVRLNLRGSPPGRSLAKGHYHMDRVRDLADACLAVSDLDPGIAQRGIVIVGFSLGGALAIRLAQAPYLPGAVKAVVAVSAPLDLVATAERIARPRNRFYERWLLGSAAVRDGAALARCTDTRARCGSRRAAYPGFRRRVHRERGRVSRRGGLLHDLLARARHGRAPHSRAPPIATMSMSSGRRAASRRRRSLGSGLSR